MIKNRDMIFWPYSPALLRGLSMPYRCEGPLHKLNVLYSVMLQGRGIAIISEVRGTEMSNVVIIIIISIIIFMYV